jgi:hypothetical protein
VRIVDKISENALIEAAHRLSIVIGQPISTLRASGGFTVGAWIPSHQVQLELDLAELSDAPRVIKEW